ncbi:hypothetical protein TanjilG_09284 [Lupinus angustifolius]|uniref:Transmembrane protein n=1 Tax=Lupinus angustifolius TaxID=3871 RepID=A0A4P1RM28_LUPAN|nr:hypothetical protein TanjilG_09284 [Lupinus angustifolius]
MGNLNKPFIKFLCITLFFLYLISHNASSSSSNQEIQPQNPSSTTLSHYQQVFFLKNTHPKFLSKQERIKKRKNLTRNKKHRKKMTKDNLKTRPFSVMLPKGFVPPSGSSPCHNDLPNSVSFLHCHLSSTAQP